jgi:hypothetical protein
MLRLVDHRTHDLARRQHIVYQAGSLPGEGQQLVRPALPKYR